MALFFSCFYFIFAFRNQSKLNVYQQYTLENDQEFPHLINISFNVYE